MDRSDHPHHRLDGLTVVLPCRNEAPTVADAIRAASLAAEAVAVEHEIIVVDDGSTDDTARIVTAIVERDPRIRLLVHAHHRGFGAAVRTAFGAARMPWVFVTTADLEFDPSELSDFLPETASSDLLVGWPILRSDSINRRLNSFAWNWLIRRVFQLPVRDVDCAFKLVRLELIDRLGLESTGPMISTELVVKALRAGARVGEVGVHHHPAPAGSHAEVRPRLGFSALRDLARLHGSLRRTTA